MLVGLCLLGGSGCAPRSTGTVAQANAPPLPPVRRGSVAPGEPARRQCKRSRPDGFRQGASLGQSKEGTAFFRDFQPGAYRFTVQPYGTPTGQSESVLLAPGMQSYLQVQAAPNWQIGSTAGGGSFVLLVMTPEIAQQYLPGLAYLGER